MATKITVIKVRKISSPNVNEELRWLGSSLGLFGLRDKDSSCFRVFISLLKSSKRNRSLTSDEIAGSLRLSRGTVVHHLTKLMESGLVVREKEGYLLRENNLESVIRDIKRDMEMVFEEMHIVAQEIDRGLGL